MKKILNILLHYPRKSAEYVADATSLNKKKVTTLLYKMKRMGVVENNKAGKTLWKISNDFMDLLSIK